MINFGIHRLLRQKGILGMNQRNTDYIGRFNNRKYYPIVDDKLKTKQRATQFHIPTPTLITSLSTQHEIKYPQKWIEEYSSFAIKPSKGSGGKGILVITEHDGEIFTKPSGQTLTLFEIQHHLSNILAGLHSLSGNLDTAIIEELIYMDEIFEGYSHEGIPDIRIIVFQGYPVMAMVRLSTHSSDGKANLHQGALGVGVNIATGQCIDAIYDNERVTHHPDTHKKLSDLQLKNWDELLRLASGCYEMSNLGYIGVDLVLDKFKGPMLLELNARPGLSIQVANKAGLIPRLQQVEAFKHTHPMPETVEQRVKRAQEWFI